MLTVHHKGCRSLSSEFLVEQVYHLALFSLPCRNLAWGLDTNMLMLMLFAVPQPVKSSVSKPGVLCLLSASMKLWQSDFLACEGGEIPDIFFPQVDFCQGHNVISMSTGTTGFLV